LYIPVGSMGHGFVGEIDLAQQAKPFVTNGLP